MEHSDSIVEKSIMKDGYRKTLRVEKVENGYIIEVSKEGNKDNDWKYECKKFISSSNPLEDDIDLSLDSLKRIDSML